MSSAPRPRRIRDRCPECGRPIKWVDVSADEGLGTRERWVFAYARCDCGLSLDWSPDSFNRAETQETAGQLRLV